MRTGWLLIGALLVVSSLPAEAASHKGRHKTKRVRKTVDATGWGLDASLGGSGTPVASAADLPDVLSNPQINESVASHRTEIMECVQRQRAEPAAQNGTLVMNWVIDRGGSTSDVAAASPGLQDSVIATCMTNLIRGWSFPRHRTQQTVEFPFKF